MSISTAISLQPNLLISKTSATLTTHKTCISTTTHCSTTSLTQPQSVLTRNTPWKHQILHFDHQVVVVEEDEKDEVIERLQRVVEEIRGMEMEKMMGGTKGGISNEVKLEMERVSGEIVDKFLEKPIRYLVNGCGKVEERVKDLKVLVRMLEKSMREQKKKKCCRGDHV